MALKIAVLSGKGGTGKTTVSVNLAHVLAKKMRVQLLDADTEEPDTHLFFDYVGEKVMKEVEQLIPRVDAEKCTKCGKCAENCQFGAINVYPNDILVFDNLCHGCGVCSLVCPEDAIREVPKELGVLRFQKTTGSINYGEGILNIGEISGVRVIERLKENIDTDNNDVIIIDSPPGASCPAVEAVRNVDFALLVTEDSAFGLHDMEIVTAVLEQMGIDYGVILNKFREKKVRETHFKRLLDNYSDKIMMRIPLDRGIAERHSNGELFVDSFGEYAERFSELFDTILNKRGLK